MLSASDRAAELHAASISFDMAPMTAAAFRIGLLGPASVSPQQDRRIVATAGRCPRTGPTREVVVDVGGEELDMAPASLLAAGVGDQSRDYIGAGPGGGWSRGKQPAAVWASARTGRPSA
jgi:hypothetical protein